MKLATSEVVTAIPIVLGIATASWFGLAKVLGAHPWWATRCGMIGAGTGLAAFFIARLVGLSFKTVVLASCLLFMSATLVAHFSKAAFVTAEEFNAATGLAWYLGTIAAWAAFTLFATTVAARFCNTPKEGQSA